VQFLGAMSYSLYLTHTIPAHAVEAMGEKVFGNAASDTKIIIMIAAQLITQLALAAVFWWAVERHFVGGSKKTK
jgi:peptidoglycan/LPS O-acetylase OafA/YrhL